MHRGFYRRDVHGDKDFGGRRPPLQIAADTAAATEDVSAGSRNGHAGGVCSPDKCGLTLRKYSRAGSCHYSGTDGTFVSPRLAGRHLKHVSLQFGTDGRVAPDYRGECLMFEIVHPSGRKVGLIPEPVTIAQPGELIS